MLRSSTSLDFGLWGEVWPGALSLGWQYVTEFDTLDIASIEIGMLDADRDSIIKYTADEAQVAWQRANGYITDPPDKLSSAPFYTEYNGTPIAEVATLTGPWCLAQSLLPGIQPGVT